MLRSIGIVFSIAAVSGAGLAQPATTTLRGAPLDSYKFLSHDELARMLTTPEAGRTYSASVINDHEYYYSEFVKRLDHGNMVEQHGHWVDQITILSGSGTLTYGGVIPGAAPNAAGEVRGASQTDGKTRTLQPGDFFIIPAGMPHKIDAAKGQTRNYVVFKARV
jgi:quercetin dioxygenase-like cupin family protein